MKAIYSPAKPSRDKMSVEAQRQHELMLKQMNNDSMITREFIKKGRPAFDTIKQQAQIKALRETTRKQNKECMKKMNIPKCVVDGVYDEDKHNEEMNIKRDAYLKKLNPPRQDTYQRGGQGIGILPYIPYIQPDWEEMEKMFPQYEKTKCHQQYADEQKIQEMRNAFEFRDRGGDMYQQNPMRKLERGNLYQNQSGQLQDELAIIPAPREVMENSQVGPTMNNMYYPEIPWAPTRFDKCRGIDKKIDDKMVPNASRTQCANACSRLEGKRIRDYNKPPMSDKQYIKHLEAQRDMPGTPQGEFLSLDAQIWNLKQSICEREKAYEYKCSKFEEKKQEQDKMNSLIPLALAGLAIYVLMD